jgi:hypothetical protein
MRRILDEAETVPVWDYDEGLSIKFKASPKFVEQGD